MQSKKINWWAEKPAEPVQPKAEEPAGTEKYANKQPDTVLNSVTNNVTNNYNIGNDGTQGGGQPANNVQPVQVAPQQGVPFVQPLVIVPYVSGSQPICYFDPTGGVTAAEQPVVDSPEKSYEDIYGDDDVADKKVPVKRKKRANAGAILAFILGLAYIAVLFDMAKYISDLFHLEKALTGYNYITEQAVGFVIIKEFIEGLIAGTVSMEINALLVPGLLTLSAVFMVFTMLCVLFSFRGGMSAFVKIVSILTAALHIALAIVLLLVEKIGFAVFGVEMICGLSLIIMLCVVACRSKKKDKINRNQIQ